MTGITKTHRGEQKVGLTIVTDAPHYSTMLGRLFNTQTLALEAEAEEQAKRNAVIMAKKLVKLQKIGIGGAKRNHKRRK